MKNSLLIMAVLAFGTATAIAGVVAAEPSGKTSPPPPPMDPCAGPISYNNVELLYAHTDWGGNFDKVDGGILRLEYSPMQNLYLAGSAEYFDYDNGHLWALTGGVGGYFPLTENIHIAGDGGILWVRDEFSVTTTRGTPTEVRHFSNSDTGWYVRPHLRAKFGCVTFHLGAIYTDLGDDGDSYNEEWFGFLNAYYQLAQNWDITAGYRCGDGTNSWSVGARYRF